MFRVAFKKAVPHNGKKEKSRVYSFFLFSYTLILLLALSSCLFFGAEVTRQLRREEAQNKLALLTSLKNDVEENLLYVEELSNTLVFNSSLQFLVKYPTVSSARDAMEQMSAVAARRDFLLDYFVYVRSSGEIVTSTVRMDADRFFDIIYEFGSLSAQQLQEETFTEYHFQDYLSVYGLYQYGSDAEVRVLPYVQSIPISSSAPPPGQLVLLLDCDEFFAQALSLQETAGGAVYVLDENGSVVYQTPDAPVLPDTVQQSEEPLVTVDDTNYTRYVSEDTGWAYLMTSPAGLYFTANLSTFGFMGGVFAVYLLVGLFLVRRIAKRSYRPVKDINDMILQSVSGSTGEDEFAVIKSTLLNQMRSGSELQRVIEAQRPAVVRDLLMQLLLGQALDWRGARSRLEELGVRFGGDRYIVVLTEVNMDSAFFLDSDIPLENNLSMARLVLQNVGCELFGAKAGCQYLDLGRTQSAFLLSPEEAKSGDALPEADSQSRTLARFCAEQFHLDIFVGISAMENGLAQLPLCYDEARKALEYSLLQTGGGSASVLFTALNTTHSDYYYPVEAEQQLLQYIRAGDAARAQEVLERIFTANFETKRVGAAAARTLLYQLAATLQRLATSDALAQGDDARLDEQLVEQVVNSSSIEYARRRLLEQISRLAAVHEARPQSRTEMLVERIADYIDHCEESRFPDLTLLSEQFGVTPQYISNVFKKYRGENVKDYIARHKLAQAKALLTGTDLPVREIAARLGYSGEIGIIRLFRKYEGVTPGDYRARHR